LATKNSRGPPKFRTIAGPAGNYLDSTSAPPKIDYYQAQFQAQHSGLLLLRIEPDQIRDKRLLFSLSRGLGRG
jgi:hypothetical protein